MFLNHVEGLLAILGADHLIVGLNKIIGEKLKLVGLVIGDENTNAHLYPFRSLRLDPEQMPQHDYSFMNPHGCAMTGNVTAKHVTPSAVLLISILPRCRFTICLTMARPSPVPPIWRERALSTR